MQHDSSLHSPVLPVLGCTLLIAVAAYQDSFAPPTFSPGAGVEVTRTFAWQISSSTSEVEVLLGGQVSDAVPVVKSDKNEEASLTLKDTYVRSATNQYLQLRRSFDDISYESEGELQIEGMGAGTASLAIACDGDSELDGVAVEFAWDADAEEYAVKYADDYEGEAELLEPLRPDADFLVLLPEPLEDVEVGSSWDVEASALADVLLPSGRVPIVKESDMSSLQGAVDPLLSPGVLETLGGDSSGEIEVTVKGRDGALITLALAVEVSFEAALEDDMAELLDGAAPEEIDLEMRTANFSSVLEGEGTLVWDTEANLPRSIQLDLATTLAVEIEVFVGGGGVDAPFELNEEREGTLAFTMELDE
ncbi:MAG: hypothetical protein AAGG01_06410 [Planctomycetota bacterium]